jgi:hypothetical protein
MNRIRRFVTWQLKLLTQGCGNDHEFERVLIDRLQQRQRIFQVLTKLKHADDVKYSILPVVQCQVIQDILLIKRSTLTAVVVDDADLTLLLNTARDLPWMSGVSSGVNGIGNQPIATTDVQPFAVTRQFHGVQHWHVCLQHADGMTFADAVVVIFFEF